MSSFWGFGRMQDQHEASKAYTVMAEDSASPTTRRQMQESRRSLADNERDQGRCPAPVGLNFVCAPPAGAIRSCAWNRER